MLALALLACTRPPPSDTGADAFPDAALAADLQAALDTARLQEGAPGATLTVVVPDVGTWVGASGLADVAGGVAVEPDTRFRIGSITKTFVTSVILQLDAEGVLSIDDKVSAWVPDAPHADEITIRQVLSHTSGLDDFVTEGAFLADPGRVWTPEELLAFVADKPLLFEPGYGWSYSNAGFVEMGLVVQAATGEPYGRAVHERLLDPLGLDDTFVPTEDEIPAGFARGYMGAGDQVDPSDVTDLLDPSASWSAGEMISTGQDLADWADALYGGDVLDPDHLAEMTTATVLLDGRTVGYGLGCDVRTIDYGPVVGHSGSTMGFTSQMRYAVADGTTVVSLDNDFLADADVIDAAAWAVLEAR